MNKVKGQLWPVLSLVLNLAITAAAHAASAPTYTEENCYDSLGRLNATKRTSSSSTIEQYNFDLAGNRTNKTLDVATTYVPGAFTLSLSPEASPVVINEGGTANFTITRTAGAGAHVITIKVTGNNAADLDLTLSSPTITFAPTDTSKTFTVTAVQDALVEGDEDFSMSLFVDCDGAVTSGNFRTIRVHDDD